MPNKVYWKELRTELEETRRYITRWELHLSAPAISGLTSEQIACIIAVLDAITECLALLPENTPIN